jgi:hypothetical protein
VDIINGRVLPDKPEEKEYDYTPTKQYAYSWEQKLAAIDYF